MSRGAPAPRPRASGFVREDQRHTVRVRVPKKWAAVLANRWKVTETEAVLRAVQEAAESAE